jgi:hypothetical protein
VALDKPLISKPFFPQKWSNRLINCPEHRGLSQTKLVEEFNLEKSQIRNRLSYSGYPIGNYRNVTDNVIKIGFLQSYIDTMYVKTARKEIMRQIERVKKENLENKLKQIKEDF